MDNVKYVGARHFDPKLWSSAGFTLYAISVPHTNGPWDAIFCKTEELAKQVVESLSGTRSQVSCKARTANVGANDPQDCDWPFCGCDHAADKVLETLQESGVCLKRNCGTQAQAAQPMLAIPKGTVVFEPDGINRVSLMFPSQNDAIIFFEIVNAVAALEGPEIKRRKK